MYWGGRWLLVPKNGPATELFLPMASAKQMLFFLPLWAILLCTHPCHSDVKLHATSRHHLRSLHPVPDGTQDEIQEDAGRSLLHDNGGWGLLQDAQEEQGYYLQQLFLHYGQNGTLSFRGLTNLLQSLGLGQVQVVEIQHEDLGHGHVSHLDILDVQEQKHVHLHSSLEHASSNPGDASTRSTSSSGVSEKKQSVKVWRKQTTQHSTVSHAAPPTDQTWTAMDDAGNGGRWMPANEPDMLQGNHRWAGRDVLERLLLRDHSSYNHLHEDCLNVTQLLVNFGLSGTEELTPQQFSLICPALLYQIDSRVCIQHHDNVRHIRQEEDDRHMAVLGFGFLAITIISVPSLLAILLVPFLSQSLFRFLLAFLMALAVGTLCGDALLHLLPHAQGGHHEVAGPNQTGIPEERILKGLSVLAGIYLLFLIENLLVLIKQRPRKKSPKKESSGSLHENLPVLQEIISTEDNESPAPSNPEAVSIDESSQERAARVSFQTSVEDLQQHSGHSHGPRATGIADIAWMVILGDGVHNFTDGLAIGAAFSQGIPSGLSTSIAVFCHELPHELGDFAVLLQAGMPVRQVMLFSLLSAFLGYLGMFVGASVSQTSYEVTPWMFAVTAGIFLYVALVDMLPDMLQRNPGRNGQTRAFILRNAGFLLGAALMLCIALFEDQIQFSRVDL